MSILFLYWDPLDFAKGLHFPIQKKNPISVPSKSDFLVLFNPGISPTIFWWNHRETITP